MNKEDLVNEKGDKKIYEIGYLLLPSISEDRLLDEVSKLRAVIEKEGGNIVAEGAPQPKNLTYFISKVVAGKKQKYNNAYFGWLKFEVSSDDAVTIKKKIDSLENVLRFLFVASVINVAPISAKNIKFVFDEAEVETETAITDVVEGGEKVLDESIDELVIE